jgi:hypothetical protein
MLFGIIISEVNLNLKFQINSAENNSMGVAQLRVTFFVFILVGRLWIWHFGCKEGFRVYATNGLTFCFTNVHW